MRWPFQRTSFSIHALLAESDPGAIAIARDIVFFYPRSPCGERLSVWELRHLQLLFSIHALLAESDDPARGVFGFGARFSIHALLAESDGSGFARLASGAFFYPRSPCGERPWQRGSRITYVEFSIHALLAESDNDGTTEAQDEYFSIHALLAESDVEYIPPEDQSSAFLSTLSLRRATPQGEYTLYGRILFYPRSPCGERPIGPHVVADRGGFSIHALLAESDLVGNTQSIGVVTFLSTLSLRRATGEGE